MSVNCSQNAMLFCWKIRLKNICSRQSGDCHHSAICLWMFRPCIACIPHWFVGSGFGVFFLTTQALKIHCMSIFVTFIMAFDEQIGFCFFIFLCWCHSGHFWLFVGNYLFVSICLFLHWIFGFPFGFMCIVVFHLHAVQNEVLSANFFLIGDVFKLVSV